MVRRAAAHLRWAEQLRVVERAAVEERPVAHLRWEALLQAALRAQVEDPPILRAPAR